MTNAELIDALNRLDALFSDESKWTKCAFGRTAAGDCVGSATPGAVCWCLAGGCFLTMPGLQLYNAVAETAQLKTLSEWNDAPERTFADVKRLIAETRARLEAV